MIKHDEHSQVHLAHAVASFMKYLLIIRCHKPTEPTEEAGVTNSSCLTLCNTLCAFNLLQHSCLILTSALLQVQLF